MNTSLPRRLQEEYESEMEYYHNQLAWRKNNPNQPEPQKPTEPDLTPLSAPQIMARLFMKREDKANPLSRLQRYEATLHRTLTRTLKDYHLLQQNEANQPAPPRSTDEPITRSTDSTHFEPTVEAEIKANPALPATGNSDLQSKIQNPQSKIPLPPQSTDEPITRSPDQQ